jgi:uroporphyrin-III C-methyltransferase
MTGVGRVTLVGAGPGAPDLLTLRAVRAIAEADVLLVDDLVHPEVLLHRRAGARVIPVGKRGGCRSTPQAFIHRLMCRLARQGHVVVRLKGGDPFVFGRGGEELQALQQAGIACSVVPGITAGIAAAHALGIPATHRGLARSITLVTAHANARGDGAEPVARADWPALAALLRSGGTLAVYMGVAQLQQLVATLQAEGVAADLPCAVVQNASLPEQRELRCTLGALPARVRAAGLGSPAMLMLGSVAGMDLRTVLTTDLPQDAAGHATC